MNAVTESPREGRPKREEITKTERRRRKAGNKESTLTIPQEVFDKHPEMDFRWGLDSEGRMEQLTQNDDWDKVPGVEPIHAGTNSAGNAVKHHALMKPKKFMQEDRAEKRARLDDLEQSKLNIPDKQQAIARGAPTYAVEGNKI